MTDSATLMIPSITAAVTSRRSSRSLATSRRRDPLKFMAFAAGPPIM